MQVDPEDTILCANVRAASYFVASMRMPCPHCGASTALTAVALPPEHETWDCESEQWQAVPVNAFLFHLEAISATVRARLLEAAPNLAFDRCWENHCEHCGRTLNDQEVHGEPGRGFTPLSEDEAADIVLTEVFEAFEGHAAGYSLEPEFFACMRRG